MCCILFSDRFYKTGSTAAVVVLVLKSHFLFAHCGDSRILLVRDIVIAYESKDYKPNRKSEINEPYQRNQNIRCEGCWIIDVRLLVAVRPVVAQHTKLPVSRGLRDIWFKIDHSVKRSEQPVIHTPKINVLPQRQR